MNVRKFIRTTNTFRILKPRIGKHSLLANYTTCVQLYYIFQSEF